MVDIFISYKRERFTHAQRLATVLEANGFSVWWDYSLIVGPAFRDQIERQISLARAVVVLWCTASIQSKFVRSEADRADRQKKLFQALLENVVPPLGFSEAQNQNLAHWTGAPNDPGIQAFMQAIATKIGKPVSPLPNVSEALITFLPSLPRLEPVADYDPEELLDGEGAAVAPTGDRDLLFFRSCQTADDFEAFLQRYSNSEFAPLARNRMIALDVEWISSLGLNVDDWSMLESTDILAKIGANGSRAELEPRAKRGCREAMTLLALRLNRSGDHAEALELLKRAATAGFPRAQAGLAYMLAQGMGTPEDRVSAFEWNRKAASQGSIIAMFNLASSYLLGLGVARDLEKARELALQTTVKNYASSAQLLAAIDAVVKSPPARKRARGRSKAEK